jgi:hypothetical protein
LRTALVSRAAALGLVALSMHAGCAVTGTYEPRPSRRISQLDPGGQVYVRDGRRFRVGVTADGEDLVSGNDVAVRLARRGHRQVVAGWIIYATGVAALATGVGLLAASDDHGGGALAGRIVVATSLVPMLASLPFLLGGRANLQDAVNVYNDDLDRP